MAVLKTFFGYFSAHKSVFIWLLRIVIGGVFIASGLAKAIDIWGTVYKIEEYLTVWNAMQPRSLVVVVALSLSAAEFIIGTMLAVGAYKRVSVWILIVMMIFMLPLTLYIYIKDPVSDCGCFGDFIKLSNGASFIKNIFVTGALICMIRCNHKVAGLYHAYIQWIAVAFCGVYIVTIALLGYNVQPLIDFRSFPVGTSLVLDENGDEVEFEFLYEKNGETRAYDQNNIPDSSWTFVDRHIISGQLSSSTELVIYDSNLDVTSDVLSDDGEQILIVLPQIERADISFTYIINEMYRYMKNRGGSLVELAAANDRDLDILRDMSMAAYPIYSAESTVLKELSRGVMSAVYLVDGEIIWKRTLGSIDVDMFDGTIEDENIFNSLIWNGERIFMSLSISLAVCLLALWLVDRGGKGVNRMLKWKRCRCKSQNNE